MEFTDKGLQLTTPEARNLAEVFDITAQLNDWGLMSGVTRQPSQEERSEARALAWQTTPISGPVLANPNITSEGDMVLSPEYFPVVRKIAELALENSQKVIAGLCTPNVCDGYRSEWRPAAHMIMAMTAEISEKIQVVEQNPDITTKRLNSIQMVPPVGRRAEVTKTIEERNREVGQVLRARRYALGYNQAEIALIAGISKGYLNMIESGKKWDSMIKNKQKHWRPSKKVILGICAALDLDEKTILAMAGYDIDA